MTEGCREGDVSKSLGKSSNQRPNMEKKSRYEFDICVSICLLMDSGGLAQQEQACTSFN